MNKTLNSGICLTNTKIDIIDSFTQLKDTFAVGV